MDHEDPYDPSFKFYENFCSLSASDSEEEQIFMRLFPRSLIGKAEDYYSN